MVADVIEEWTPFLERTYEAEPDVIEVGSAVERTDEAEPRWRFRHDSLRSFVRGQADLKSPRTEDKQITEGLARSTRAAHSRIVANYVARWGGLAAGLTKLRQAGSRAIETATGDGMSPPMPPP
jgi:hypothetical protein